MAGRWWFGWAPDRVWKSGLRDAITGAQGLGGCRRVSRGQRAGSGEGAATTIRTRSMFWFCGREWLRQGGSRVDVDVGGFGGVRGSVRCSCCKLHQPEQSRAAQASSSERTHCPLRPARRGGAQPNKLRCAPTTSSLGMAGRMEQGPHLQQH